MNTVQKIQKLNEMATTLIETEDMVDKIEQKLLLKNPSEKQKAEKSESFCCRYANQPF